jgi:hypothetical protein
MDASLSVSVNAERFTGAIKGHYHENSVYKVDKDP